MSKDVELQATRCGLTDEELADPEYMRGYIEELHETLHDVLHAKAAATAPNDEEIIHDARIFSTENIYSNGLTVHFNFSRARLLLFVRAQLACAKVSE